MSVVITTPNADTAVELEDGKQYAVFQVRWEYTEARYVLEVKGDVEYSSYEDLVRKSLPPRDEGMKVLSVTHL